MISLVFLFFSLLAASTVSNLINWDEYIKRFPEIELSTNSRFHFENNIKLIIEHNSGNSSYKFGITQFLHLSDAQWSSRFHNITLDKPSNDIFEGRSLNLRSLPLSWDWRSAGVTTPVKDQSSCGSCWGFSATETVETTWAIKSGELKVLSPQQLVDCSKLNSGCNGGLQSRAYSYLQKTPQCLESSYPYTAKDGTCHSCKGEVPLLSGYNSIKAGDESSMGQAVLITSLAIAIQADQKQFQMYSSGVTDFDCGKNLDHAVTIEGYGNENGKDYWLVRNSWGTSWGDKGYIKMARGKDLCGLSQSVVYPKF